MDFHHAVLPNGLQVIAETSPFAHSIAAGYFVRTGSRDESPALAGVSHFLEHMAFKGGDRRDALAINRDFDKVGAKHNAQTSEEDTIFFAASLPEYLPDAFDVLSELMRPRLDTADFETEKEVIVEEIKMYLDNPMMTAYEEAKAAHYGGHPLGQSVLGTAESIQAMTADQMRDYHARRYGPANLVLAFCGKGDWPALLAMAEEKCSGWSGPLAHREAAPPKGTGAFRKLVRKDDQQQVTVALSDGPSLESEHRYAAALLSVMLGDHVGSRLYWELVDPGLADGAEVSFQEFNLAGAFLTFLSQAPERAQANLERAATLFRNVARDGFDPDELQRAKNKALSRNVIRGERPMGRLMSLGYHWTYRREYLSVADEIAAYQAVTLKDVGDVLEQWPLAPFSAATAGPNDALVAVN